MIGPGYGPGALGWKSGWPTPHACRMLGSNLPSCVNSRRHVVVVFLSDFSRTRCVHAMNESCLCPAARVGRRSELELVCRLGCAHGRPDGCIAAAVPRWELIVAVWEKEAQCSACRRACQPRVAQKKQNHGRAVSQTRQVLLSVLVQRKDAARASQNCLAKCCDSCERL